MADSVVLVEGESDRAAVETIAKRLDRDMHGVEVVAMGGSSPFPTYLNDLVVDRGFSGRLSGLCDLAETNDLLRGLESAGFGADLSPEDAEALGFFLCDEDLEDEMIRSIGTDPILEIFEREGELRGFHKFQNQPAWRGRALEDQIHRFLGIRSGRKVRYGSLLAKAVPLDRIPEPLAGVLDHM